MPDLPEMSPHHRQRTVALLADVGTKPGYCGTQTMLSAYHAVLIKDLIIGLNELLLYKQQEVHR